MDNKLLFIINPISGTRSKVDIPRLIEEIFKEEEYTVAFTEYAGHASILAQEAVQKGFRGVIAVGGDGTINEVARSLINSDTVLGIIPVGSGNGLARELGISMQIKKALKIIEAGCIRVIDYGLANDHPFFCTCGVGFDARVSYKFAKDKKRGGLMYVKNVITEFLNYQPETYEILMDNDEIKEKGFLVTVANASQWGNNAFIAPDADMEDGKLNITLLKPFTYIDIPNLALQLFTRMIDMNSHICTFEKDAVSILREKPGVIHLDGEPMIMPERIDITTNAGGLKIFVPAKRVTIEQQLHRLVNQLVNEFPF
ncbi:MAG: diacylglycerol/lipid kinase family protein [Bacteroidales bacterium]